MTTWLIEPRDPLIVRDGRPFGPNPGARARSLPFPFPSTVSGGLRTRLGPNDQGLFDEVRQSELRRVAVRGPLLVELAETGEIERWLFPAPADALLTTLDRADETTARRQALVPLETPGQTNLPADLAPVGLTGSQGCKPAPAAPRFWDWAALQQWLTQAPPDEAVVRLTDLGHNGPLTEQRMHVSIDPKTLTNLDGALFQTSGLEFARLIPPAKTAARRLALALETEAAPPETLAPLGGERRLMRWRKSKAAWPAVPAGLAATIAGQGACRLLLATPGYFEAGFRPRWLLESRYGVNPILRAAVVPRPQVVSGWDFVIKKPKPTRRLAPAGSVYFLQLKGQPTDIERWVKEIWLQNISDEDEDSGQARRDGFGLALLGVWSGALQPLKEQSS